MEKIMDKIGFKTSWPVLESACNTQTFMALGEPRLQQF